MEVNTKKNLALLPYNHEKIRDKHLVVNVLGDWCILTDEEFRRVNRYDIPKEGDLHKKLKEASILVDDFSLEDRIHSYRSLNLNLFCQPYLHIAVISQYCNLSCHYCQTKKDAPLNMNKEVAVGIIDVLAENEAPFLSLEFQGGEPLFNWNIMKFLVEEANNLNKGIQCILVTNLLLVDKEKLDFIIDNNVAISSSLDGPEFIHDKNRVFSNGKGTYKEVVQKLEKVRREYKKRGLRKKVGLIPTITKHSLPYHKEIIDEYLKQGQESIPLRYANELGVGRKNWDDLGVSVKDFCEFWTKSADYIIELNKKGKKISERTLQLIAYKVFNKMDPRYVDMTSPCGAGRSVLTYTPSGDVYTCDEARMLEDDLFKVGNVLRDKYHKLMDSSVIFDTAKSSILEIWDYKSPYKLWGGTCPVLNYLQEGSPIVKMCNSRVNRIQKFQFRYFFDRMLGDKESVDVFKSWVVK